MLRSGLWGSPTIAREGDPEGLEPGRQADIDIVRRTTHGVWAKAFCFLILIFASSYASDYPVVVATAGACLLLVLSLRVSVRGQWERSYRLCRSLYFSTLVVSGLFWGVFYAFTVWLYGVDHPTTLLFLACMLTICSAALVSLAPNRIIMFTFLAASVAPSALVYCFSGGAHGWTMATGAVGFLGFSLLQGNYRHEEYWSRLQAIALLKRKEKQRDEAEAALNRAHEQLEQKIKESTSELVIANQVLKTHKAELAALFEQAADCVLVTTHEAVVVQINASGSVMTGYSRDELVGKSAFDLLRPQDAVLMRPVLREIRTGRAVLRETQILRKDGKLVPVEFSAQMLSDGRMIALVRDVTARKEAEEAHRAGEERWRSVFENSAIGISVTDLNGAFVAANPAYQRMVGYNEDELRHMSYREITIEKDRDRNDALRAELVEGRRTEFRLEKRNRRKDGGLIWVRITCSITPESKLIPRYVMAVVEDITERKRAEEIARRAQNALHELSGRLIRVQDTERRRLARELHDTTAQNIAALGMRLETLAGETADDRIRAELTGSLALAEQCLGEIRTFSYSLHPPVLDDMGLPSALSWFLKGFVDRSGIKVHLDMPQDLGRLPQETETALYRVAQESLTNIYRHSGSSTAGIRITRRSKNVVMEVEDHGHGMSAPGLKGGSESAAATGVGIASMRERVLKAGGAFQILSGKKGTSVRVILPLSTVLTP